MVTGGGEFVGRFFAESLAANKTRPKNAKPVDSRQWDHFLKKKTSPSKRKSKEKEE